MEETDKLVLKAKNYKDFDPILCKAPSLFPNVKCLTLYVPLSSFPTLPSMQNLRYLKALDCVNFLVLDKNLSVPTVTHFTCFDDSIENIRKLAECLPKLFPNLHYVNLWCSEKKDIQVNRVFDLPPRCETVMGSSDVLDYFAQTEGIKNLAVDEIYPGTPLKRLLGVNSELKTLIVDYTATLDETWTGLVPAILKRFESLEFLEIRNCATKLSDYNDFVQYSKSKMEKWISKTGKLINSHPLKLLVVSGHRNAQVVYQKVTLTRMNIEVCSWLNEEFQSEQVRRSRRFCLNGPLQKYNGVGISIVEGNLKRVQSSYV